MAVRDSKAVLGPVAGMMEARTEPAPAEQEAIEALDRGDRKGTLTVLMEAYGASIYRYCRQMVVDADLAEDVHQMTFVQAYESLGRFARRSSLRTWLYGIARHRCLDALKTTRRRRQKFELVDELPEEPDSREVPEERLTARSLSTALEECLQQLAPRTRTAVLHRYQDGFSYPEMARVCGERPATLQARVARALPGLRRCIEEQGLSL